MSGTRLVLGLLTFAGVFAVALIYTQFFAYYRRDSGLGTVATQGRMLVVSDYEGIDGTSSPLKLRGCLRIDPALVADLPVADDATPLVAPFWFRCFDAGTLSDDLAAGRAVAHVLGREDPAGFDRMIALYPDGRAYLWRQLAAELRD